MALQRIALHQRRYKIACLDTITYLGIYVCINNHFDKVVEL